MTYKALNYSTEIEHSTAFGYGRAINDKNLVSMFTGSFSSTEGRFYSIEYGFYFSGQSKNTFLISTSFQQNNFNEGKKVDYSSIFLKVGGQFLINEYIALDTSLGLGAKKNDLTLGSSLSYIF